MLAKTLMIQGTASHVGKSLLVTAFCRILKQDGFNVAPFKAQNMSLNSFVTKDGKEIARAQAVQAEAAKTELLIEMNPILLKPSSDHLSQVIVRGKVVKNMDIREYYAYKQTAWQIIKEDLLKLRAQFEVVEIEGAVSPAEINIKANDLTNMAVAKEVQSPVILVADISRGGVFAAIVGTWELLDPDEKKLVKGFLINNFRGQKELLDSGIKYLENRTGIKVLGVIPYIPDLKIMAEDSLSLEADKKNRTKNVVIKVAVIKFPRISNFTDFDSLINEPGVDVIFTDQAEDLLFADLIIIPGSKNTIADLNYIRSHGLDRSIYQAVNDQKIILGICGGYQMLGKKIKDPEHVESPADEVEGLGLLSVETILRADKQTHQIEAIDLKTDIRIKGYEIHMGQTFKDDNSRSFFKIIRKGEKIVEELDGAINAAGTVMGTYIHGLFDQPEYRQKFFRNILKIRGIKYSPPVVNKDKEEDPYDRLAAVIRENIDLNYIRKILNF